MLVKTHGIWLCREVSNAMAFHQIPPYAAIYQEAAFRFTQPAADMIWGKRIPWFIRVVSDEITRRLYFQPLDRVEDNSTIWNAQGGNGHVHSRAAVKFIRRLGDRRRRFLVQRDEIRRLCYIQIEDPDKERNARAPE